MKEGWEYKKLGEVCRIYNGNSINANYKKTHYMGLTEGYPFIATKDVSFEGVIDYENGVKIPFDEELKLAKPNSVFICVEGGSAGRKIGLVNREVCFGNKLFCLESKGSVLGAFIYFYLKSELFQEQFAERLTGLIGGVSAKKFNDIFIVYPPLSEQQSIVAYLDSSFAKIDAMKANAEKALNEAKALFQASLKEMLEPKEGWEEKKLGDIATDMYRGSGVKRDQVTEKGMSCVRYGEIYTKYNYHFKECESHTLPQYVNSPKYFENGDILFAITGESVEEIGKCIAYTGGEKCIAGGDIVVMKHNNEPRYISYALSTPSAIKQKGQGKTKLKVVHTNIPSLKEISIPIAPMNEQALIADTLDALKSKVDRLQANYDKISQECDALKQAILKQVFE